jgi:hypothetical protein
VAVEARCCSTTAATARAHARAAAPEGEGPSVEVQAGEAAVSTARARSKRAETAPRPRRPAARARWAASGARRAERASDRIPGRRSDGSGCPGRMSCKSRQKMGHRRAGPSQGN